MRRFIVIVSASVSYSKRLIEGFLRRACNMLDRDRDFFAGVGIRVVRYSRGIRASGGVASRGRVGSCVRRLRLCKSNKASFEPTFR